MRDLIGKQIVTTEQRSRIMRTVKSKDTGPEMLVRRTLHSLGYRYLTHAAGLPGRPDVVFPRRRKAIFVHGCFWHGHHCARGSRMPKQNFDYWYEKKARNVARDERVLKNLAEEGWTSLVIWECELKYWDRSTLIEVLVNFLGPTRQGA